LNNYSSHKMNIKKTLYITNRNEWRSWLSKNHKTETEVWLIFYRKETGNPRISYNAAVEEALCYGWIDSTLKKIDDERFMQRFSVRRKNSVLSQMNKERIRKLIKQKKMTRAGLAAVAHAFDPEVDMKEELVIPRDILEPLKANGEAWNNFNAFPDTYKRIRIAYIESQRKHGNDQFKKALNHFVSKTARNLRIGWVGEMK